MPLLTERLRQIREQRGLTQRELARLCNVGENQINRYENGKSIPSATYLALIASNLRCSVDFLLGLSDEIGGKFGDALGPDEHRLLEAYAAKDGSALLQLIAQHLFPTQQNMLTPEEHQLLEAYANGDSKTLLMMISERLRSNSDTDLP